MRVTVEELYESMGASYKSAKRVLQTDGLIAKFIQKYPTDSSFDRMRSSWTERDAQGTVDGAHSMKGVCANLGLDDLSARASVLAEEFRPGNARTMDDAQVDAYIEELAQKQTMTLEAIGAFAAEQ